MRYEHLKNDYYNFGVREDEVCRDYGDRFPTASLFMPIGNAHSLSYRRDIERPNYSNLSSYTVYINRYTYQGGNPYLKPMYIHSLVLNSAYKWANMTVNYSRVKDAPTMATEPRFLIKSLHGYQKSVLIPDFGGFNISQNINLLEP